MKPLDQLNKQDRRISSAVWRAACESPRDETWARYRKDVGILGKRRYITEFEAFLLWVRKHWRRICKESGIQYVSCPDTFKIEEVANSWATQKLDVSGMRSILEQAALLSSLKGNSLTEVITMITGKSLSERTLRRICSQKGVPTFSRKKIYNPDQVRIIIRAVCAS